jgi:hypothetical protein
MVRPMSYIGKRGTQVLDTFDPVGGEWRDLRMHSVEAVKMEWQLLKLR